MKKPPSKVAHNWPPTFLCTGPAAQTTWKQKSRTTKSSLMQDWAIRLGFQCINLAQLCDWPTFMLVFDADDGISDLKLALHFWFYKTKACGNPFWNSLMSRLRPSNGLSWSEMKKWYKHLWFHCFHLWILQSKNPLPLLTTRISIRRGNHKSY